MKATMRWIKCAAVLITVLFLSACVGHAKPEYEKNLFDTSYVHTVDVTIAEADWQDLITHPEEKTKYEADLVIDGEEVKQVSFSAKGNSSLAFVKARGDSNRYSFKINFGKNIKGQTFQGLDKLHLQNLYADRTYMKDYIAYDLFRKMGVPAPLTSYVFITVNGKDFGLYLAAEDLDDSFLDRTCRGNGSLYQPELSEQALDDEKAEAILAGGNVIVSGARGADLKYIDDDPDSYPDIFDNAVTKRSEESDQRVIAALRKLQEGKDLKSILVTKELARYFAVNNYLMNYDTYIGLMTHNCYLYEKNGKLSVFPWDYNLAFGAFSMDAVLTHANDTREVINMGIDSPLLSIPPEERPLWSRYIADETCRNAYHAAMDQFLKEQIESGALEKEIDRVYTMIRPYIENDPTKLCTLQDTDEAHEILTQICLLRAESIRRQLNGSLASETKLQNPADRVDPAGADVQDLRY